MSEHWILTTKRADFRSIGERFHLDQVVARLIHNRDICGDEAIRNYLYGDLEDLPDTLLMKDMDKAIHILQSKIADGALIRVVGDYDIDGVMSTYILKTGLKSLGAQVSAVIPHRVRDGYGINVRMIDEAYSDGVDTIITCDNGISAADACDRAHELGMTFIVTDHHEVSELPLADAVVDPKQEDCQYPFKPLCGAGIAWLLIREMAPSVAEDLLPFAAFATVGDVVPLIECNRILVRKGLEKMRQTNHIGLNALLEANHLKKESVTSDTLAFTLGPCINAAGRLEDAMLALQLMESDDSALAKKRAEYIRELNERRKVMTDEAFTKADEKIAKDHQADRILVVYLPDCHESIAGIVAGRIREKYHRPSIVLTKGQDVIKGSARSADAYNIFEGLTQDKHRLARFGGHPLAAGMTLSDHDVEGFRQELNDNCHLTEEDLCDNIYIDVPMPMSYVTPELIRQFDVLEPYGTDNSKPVFAMKNVKVERAKIIGRDNDCLRLNMREESGFTFEAICFKQGQELYHRLSKSRTIHMIYYPKINDFNGRQTIQAVITHFL
ncbi:MAG: single-stranded-DNA-specific exonuclease RecJ [Lachnospiraceae bacterium]|nr:single-stranded-DNA-specific exonuclease RecJ [Candidatus Equihabitans merdae]